MPLLKLASSILLALLLASLSALASPPAASGTALSNQALAESAARQAGAGRDQKLLALSESRRVRGFATPADLPMPTVPLAGETVPGLGQ
jgi:hypothetical protein